MAAGKRRWRRLKLLSLFTVVGLTVGVGAADPLIGLYEQLYPSDPAKRMALELCILADNKFNRLDVEEREACYRQKLPQPGTGQPVAAAVVPSTGSAGANFIDLWRAAGEGYRPQNDIRGRQQNDRYVQPLSSR